MLLTAVPTAIWLYILIAGGGFWWRPARLTGFVKPPVINKRVVVVNPARNEADVVGSTVVSLLTQDLPLQLHVILVDDNSMDGPSAVAIKAALEAGESESLTVLPGLPIAPGWTGAPQAVAF